MERKILKYFGIATRLMSFLVLGIVTLNAVADAAKCTNASDACHENQDCCSNDCYNEHCVGTGSPAPDASMSGSLAEFFGLSDDNEERVRGRG